MPKTASILSTKVSTKSTQIDVENPFLRLVLDHYRIFTEQKKYFFLFFLLFFYKIYLPKRRYFIFSQTCLSIIIVKKFDKNLLKKIKKLKKLKKNFKKKLKKKVEIGTIFFLRVLSVKHVLSKSVSKF